MKKLKQKLKRNQTMGNKQSNPFLKMVISQMSIKAWKSYTDELKDMHKTYQDEHREFFEDIMSEDSQMSEDEEEVDEFEQDELNVDGN